MRAIYERRSIRKFTNEPVDEALLMECIKAGMNAPSAGNQMPWEFIVIDKRDLLDAIMKIHPHSSMLETATVAVLVCGDLSKETRKGYWVQDCAACTQNILLAIASVGLAGVWLGVYPREDRVNGIRELFNLPAHIVPFSIVPVGYAAEKKEPNNKFFPERIHRNGW
ncbi:MAG: nitroreductase family protein [Spirochaetes bacterium]|nr:nitroreductase family protein [Spirochaetota bacterium]